MSSEWFLQSLGDMPIHIGDGNYSGKYPKASDFVDNGVPFISASDFRDGRISSEDFRYISEQQHSTLLKGHIKSGDILVVTRGNGVGNIVWVDEQYDGCNINAQLVLLRADEYVIHNRYMYYLLSSQEYKEKFVSYSSGSAQPQLPIRALKLLELSFPSFQKQVKIASILLSFDDKIQLNRQINQTLEQMAQAIFQSWFVDFEPVKAKIAAREDWLARQADQGQPHADASPFASAASAAQSFARASNQASNQAAKKASSETAADAAQSPAAQFLAALPPAEQTDLETVMNRAAMCAISGKADADLDAMPAADYQRLYHTASLFPDDLIESELGDIPKGWAFMKVEELLDRMKVKARYKKDEVTKYGSTPVYEQGTDILLGFHDGMPSINATPSEPAFIFGDHTCVMFLACHGFDVSQNVIPLRGSKFSTIWTYYAVKDVQTFQEYRRHWAELIVKEVVTPTSSIADAFSEIVLGNIQFQEKLNNQKLTLEQLRDTLLPKLLSGELDISALTDLAEASDAATGAAYV